MSFNMPPGVSPSDIPGNHSAREERMWQTMEVVVKALIRLDMMLAGCSERHARLNARNQEIVCADVWALISHGYYLSNGGYSRISFNDQTGEPTLVYGGMAGVQAKCLDDEPETVAVRQAMADALAAAG